MVSVFCGLQFTSHFVDHAFTFTRSSLSGCAVSCGSSTIKYRLVSSTNNVIVELISVSMSSMKTMNKIVLQSSPGIHQHLCHAN